MDIGGRTESGTPESGKHYMNKMFGAGLDRARQADEEQAKRGGSVARITIEPREDGRGHRVTVEKHSVVMHGGGGPNAGAGGDRAEHEFEKPEDALEFLHELLHGGEPEEEATGRPERPRDRGRGGGELEAALASQDRGSGDRGEDQDAWQAP